MIRALLFLVLAYFFVGGHGNAISVQDRHPLVGEVTFEYKFGQVSLPKNSRVFDLPGDHDVTRQERVVCFCIDPADSAQFRPLTRMPQRVFSYRGPDVAFGCCRT